MELAVGQQTNKSHAFTNRCVVDSFMPRTKGRGDEMDAGRMNHRSSIHRLSCGRLPLLYVTHHHPRQHNRAYVSPEDFQALQGRVTNAEASKTGEDALLVTVNGLVFTAR